MPCNPSGVSKPVTISLFEREDGKMVIVEVKGDHQVNTPVVQAKRAFAEQMAIASYEMIKGTDASVHSYQRLLD